MSSMEASGRESSEEGLKSTRKARFLERRNLSI